MWCTSLILLGASSIALAGIVPAQPVITSAPSLEEIELARRQNGVDLASLLPILATAVPPSILALALTNVPAVSRLLWSEFLDDKTPAWFSALPTDVQQYLSGEFGPTTTASSTPSTTPASSASSTSSTSSTSAASPSALGSARGEGNSGLPLWAKIVIGIAIPLFVIGLIAGIILCCCRRRRSRRRNSTTSRAPTPAFISSSHQGPQHSNRPVERVPLRGGYYSNSSPDSHHRASRSSHHLSSSSDDYRTPIGGRSYEDMPPAGVIPHTHRTRRDSSKSLNSLHSVPEVPEPTHYRNQGDIPLPRSPRRSRDLSHDAALNNGSLDSNGRRISPLNPAYANNGGPLDKPMQQNPSTAGQGIYAGYHNPHHVFTPNYHPENPFNDHSPPRQSAGYMSGHSPPRQTSGHISGAGMVKHHGERRQSQSRDAELFIPASSYGGEHPAERNQTHNDESSWPLKSAHKAGNNGGRRARRNSWEEGDDSPVYEM